MARPRPLLLALVVAAFAGCTLPGDGAPAGPPAAGDGAAGGGPAAEAPLDADAVVVQAVDDAFDPPAVAVATGGSVAWRNAGASPHSVTLPALGLDVILEPGGETRATFAEPGTYAYRCKLHRGMAGNVTVGGVADPVAPPAPGDASAGGGDAPAAPPPASGVVRDVAVVDDAFQPGAVSVPVGGSVRWTDRGGAHTVTFDALPIDRVLDTGDAFSATFDQPGTYAYRCRFHRDMVGSVTVAAAGDGDAAPPPDQAPPVVVLDGGNYDERPVEVAAGTPVT
ncbi:MAG TPA: cupredoxin domain-containing protein, partial [Candidatus Thermoplasmatota archaeon]|nr:cupredoxin domain-containing protein [Candidatus Thermoplasmatota archaeon]